MKTKAHRQMKGLPSRPEQFSTAQTGTDQSATVAPVAAGTVPPLDFAKRQANRQLPTEQLIALLRTEAPRFFEIAEVVGQWVWIQFTEKQPREVTSVLAQFGFHWNTKRQAWQHPCGHLSAGTPNEPRAKYRSYFPADAQAA
jgi:hypothetical protein